VASKAEQLEQIYTDMENDPNPLLVGLRHSATRLVPGDGDLVHPKLVIVGEAPGAKEDAAGYPFVGPSGKLLAQLLATAGLDRREVWITNVVKYRPPNNRTPDPLEVEASLPYLRREVALVAGAGCSMLVGLGRTACCAMSGENISVVERAGSWCLLRGGWRMFISCHPSWGIRNPGNRRKMVKDFDKLRKTMI
jgi:uracil-DNA glycosylase